MGGVLGLLFFAIVILDRPIFMRTGNLTRKERCFASQMNHGRDDWVNGVCLYAKKSIAFDLIGQVEHDSDKEKEQKMVTIETRLNIDHPAHEVWSLFIDPGRWDEISPLLRSRYPEEPFDLGSVHTLLLAPEGLPRLKIMVEVIGKMDTYLCWRGGRAGIWAEHYFYAQPVPGGERTTWIHGERFYGRLGSVIGGLAGHRIQRCYESFNRDLAACLNRVI